MRRRLARAGYDYVSIRPSSPGARPGEPNLRTGRDNPQMLEADGSGRYASTGVRSWLDIVSSRAPRSRLHLIEAPAGRWRFSRGQPGAKSRPIEHLLGAAEREF